VEANRKQQQDDADLGQLVGERLVRHEARRERSDERACQEVADQRGNAQPMRQEAEGKGHHEPSSNGRDEW
jgi:hypothetical protein